MSANNKKQKTKNKLGNTMGSTNANDNFTDNKDESNGLFKFKSKNITLKFTNVLDLQTDKEQSIDLSLHNCKMITRDINSSMKELGVNMASFIINECGYETAGKEYRRNLLNTVKLFTNRNKIK